MHAQNINPTPYATLSPSAILDAVEAIAGPATGAVFPLNSYENRVYEVALEGKDPVIAKFYRPERWTEASIREEHQFALDLAQEEVPVVPPCVFDGETLFKTGGFMYALYPKRGGRPFEVRSKEDLRQLGRLLARIHNVGAQKPFKHRLTLDLQTFGDENIAFIEACDHIPEDMRLPFAAIAKHVIEACKTVWHQGNDNVLRIHGDCHAGNILVAQEPFLVDLDDCMVGPAIQDMWMLLPGEGAVLHEEIEILIEGYETFRLFDRHELRLTEVLRTLRMIHYTAWLAKRWQDPTFPQSFPFFKQPDYWQRFVSNLQEQLAHLQQNSGYGL